MMDLPIPYGRQEITQSDIDRVIESLKGAYLTQGPSISAFEKAFGDYVGSPHSIAVSNGTAALHLAAMALGVDSKTIAVTSPLTFAASANCVRYCGGEVMFCDIDPETGLIDLEKLADMLDGHKDIQGIIPVDYAGYPVDTETLRKIVGSDRWILEDACHAPGAWLEDTKGKKIHAGSCEYADAAIFSFHPVKHIAAGEGGMITSRSKAIFDQLTMLRTHGITKTPELLQENHGGWYYEMQELGYNYRLTDIQATLAHSQLDRAGENLSRRVAIADRYDYELANLPIILPSKPKNGLHAYHLYVIRTEKRKELYDYLHSKNILAQVHYIPVHMQPYYQSLGFRKGQFPNAEQFYTECLSLPMYPSLTEDQQAYVIEQIRSFFE